MLLRISFKLISVCMSFSLSLKFVVTHTKYCNDDATSKYLKLLGVHYDTHVYLIYIVDIIGTFIVLVTISDALAFETIVYDASGNRYGGTTTAQ